LLKIKWLVFFHRKRSQKVIDSKGVFENSAMLRSDLFSTRNSQCLKTKLKGRQRSLHGLVVNNQEKSWSVVSSLLSIAGGQSPDARAKLRSWAQGRPDRRAQFRLPRFRVRYSGRTGGFLRESRQHPSVE
jgi:hypothetical protein